MSMMQTGIIPEITVAHRIRIAREFAGLDQAELADRAEIGRTTVVNYEQGYRVPRRLYLRAIADATGVDLLWLETGMAPADAEAIPSVARPEGLEPPTFWLGDTPNCSAADSRAIHTDLTFWGIVADMAGVTS